MGVSRDFYDEAKNWVEAQWQEGVPVLDADLNAAQRIRQLWIRKALCQLLGNGSPNDGFKLAGSAADPTIEAGDIYVTGLHLFLGADTPASGQPNAPVTFPAGDGVWYLDVEVRLIDSVEDPVLRDGRLPSTIETPIKMWKADWTLRKELGTSLPAPSGTHIHIALAREVGGSFTDVRNEGLIAAGADTGFQGSEGGGLGSGHRHRDKEIDVDLAAFSGVNLEEVLGEIDARLDAVEVGAATPEAHAASHEAGGSDAINLGSLSGAITAAQHGALGTGDPHPQYLQEASHTDAAHEAMGFKKFPAASDLDMGGKMIANLADPALGSDAATKGYVDASADDAFPGYGTSSGDVAGSNGAGSAATVARSDHAHRGVRQIRAQNFNFHGDVQLVPGDGIDILDNDPNPGDIKFAVDYGTANVTRSVGPSNDPGTAALPARADHEHAGVSRIRAAANDFYDAVELVEGANVTITKPAAGQVQIASSHITDHGALLGREDDDHPQYLKAADHTGAGHRALGVLDVLDVAYIEEGASPELWSFDPANWATLIGSVLAASPTGGIGPHAEWTKVLHLGAGNGFIARPSGPGNWDDAVVLMNEVPQFGYAPLLVSGKLCKSDGGSPAVDEYVEHLKIRFYNVSDSQTYPGPPWGVVCRFYVAGKKT